MHPASNVFQLDCSTRFSCYSCCSYTLIGLFGQKETHAYGFWSVLICSNVFSFVSDFTASVLYPSYIIFNRFFSGYLSLCVCEVELVHIFLVSFSFTSFFTLVLQALQLVLGHRTLRSTLDTQLFGVFWSSHGATFFKKIVDSGGHLTQTFCTRLATPTGCCSPAHHLCCYLMSAILFCCVISVLLLFPTWGFVAVAIGTLNKSFLQNSENVQCFILFYTSFYCCAGFLEESLSTALHSFCVFESVSKCFSLFVKLTLGFFTGGIPIWWRPFWTC